MQIHHPAWAFNASLGLPVGSGETPCPLFGNASGDNGVVATPKAVPCLVHGLLVSLSVGSVGGERPGDAAGSCWPMVAHPFPLLMSQFGGISAHGKEVAMLLPPPPGSSPQNSFSFPFFQ